MFIVTQDLNYILIYWRCSPLWFPLWRLW